jgi:hypothetical protein
MANILGLITVNNKEVLEVDAIPSAGAGTPASVGSYAMFDDGLAGPASGKSYVKIGPNDVDWDIVLTATVGGIGQGNYLRLPIYDTDASGYHVDDTVSQNGQLIDIAIQPQATRSAAIEYRIPNPGDAITAADFVLSEGDQTINGNKTFGNNVIVNGDMTVNGTLTFLNSTNTTITDKLVTLNKGGAAASASGAGLEFEENAIITGYMKIAADRAGFELLAPAGSYKVDLDLSSLTAAHVQKFANTDGTFVMRPTATPGVAGQVAFFSDANNVISASGLSWDNVGAVLSASNLTVSNVVTLSALGAGIVHSSAGGVLSSSAVLLGSEVSGVLPVANGGTNSSTALNNNRVMVSSGGAIVEAAAMLDGQIMIGSTGNAPVVASISGTSNQVSVTGGAGSITLSLPQDIHSGASPVFLGLSLTGLTQGSVVFAGTSGALSQDNSYFFFDATNHRLGLGTVTPSRLLDVYGSSLFQGPLKVADYNFPKANFEIKQAGVQTTNATVTQLASIAIPIDSEVVIEARVMGRKGATGDSASYIRTAKFKNVGGTVTMSNLQTDYTAEDITSWDSTMVVSGGNAIINVKGAASSTIDWAGTYFVQVMQ